MTDVLASIYPVMRKYGVTSPPEEFHRIVNLAFHRAESQIYDAEHRCMWESLPQQYELLLTDFENVGGLPEDGLSLLDVGCGTGLASELLLRTRLGKSIVAVDLLDTSVEMLHQAKQRADGWGVKAELLHGTVSNLTNSTKRYDIIIVCSVLHHIPDLANFLHEIQTLQSDGGILIHLQDPNGDYLTSPALKQRIDELENSSPNGSQRTLSRFHPRRVLKKIRRKLVGIGDGESDYIERANQDLLRAGVIRKRMSATDIWRVTDIHVYDGNGISVKQMSSMLDQYQLIAARSYAFFGKLSSTLSYSFLAREQELIQRNAVDGAQIAAIWKRHRRC